MTLRARSYLAANWFALFLGDTRYHVIKKHRLHKEITRGCSGLQYQLVLQLKASINYCTCEWIEKFRRYLSLDFESFS